MDVKEKGLREKGFVEGSMKAKGVKEWVVDTEVLRHPTPGVLCEKIASVPGIDVIFAASTDLGNFSGHRQGDKEYEAMVTRIHDVTLLHGLSLREAAGLEGSPGIQLLPGSRRDATHPGRRAR
jgi:hypothetical protein